MTLPGVEVGIWQVRNRFDLAARLLADRHYSRRPDKIGSNQLGGVGRALVLVTPCERALWVTRWPIAGAPWDGLDAFRCSYFRNEGAGLSSFLIREAMDLTVQMWGDPPADGWVTWVDTRKVASINPGFCFKQAGWTLDREWKHRHLIRLRA
jgi:hypothetical protein